MKNCLYCKSTFEPWKNTIDCFNPNCEGGIEEDIIYDGLGEPSYKACSECRGKETIDVMEDVFCSEDCMREYIEEQAEPMF